MAVMAMTLFGGESVFSQTLHSGHSMINTGEATVASRADDGESADDKKPGEVPEEIVNGGWKSIGEACGLKTCLPLSQIIQNLLV